jgi:hypothetical protein
MFLILYPFEREGKAKESISAYITEIIISFHDHNTV